MRSSSLSCFQPSLLPALLQLTVAGSAFFLTGCVTETQKINADIGQTNAKAERLVKSVGNTAPGVVTKAPPAAEYEDGIWLSKNVVKVGQPSLPAVFYEEATFDRTVSSLTELAERITMRSGIPTKISGDAQQIAAGNSASASSSGNNNGNNAAAANPAQAMITGPARPRTAIRIAYANGNFKGLLDAVAARFGVYWKYANGAIQFYHTDSRTFQINAIPGDSSFSAAVSSGASSGGGGSAGSGSGAGSSAGGGSSKGVSSNNSQNTAVTSQLSVYGSIEKTILAMLSAYGKVVASPATGTITVVDTPDSLDKIASFVEAENKSLSRQVSINVTVLAVTLEDADNYGIRWDLVYQGLRNRYGISNSVARGNGSTFSAGILSTANSKFAGSELMIQALSEQGKVRRETTASVVTLNNQPVPVQVAKQSSYLQSSQTTLTAQVGATTTLTPGTITSGFNMSILPHVLNNGTIMLQFTTDISSLRGFRTVTSNNSSIETPEVDTRNFLQRVSMKPNETLVISGFEQTTDNLEQSGVGTPKNMLLGGTYKGASNKEIIVILITPSTMNGS